MYYGALPRSDEKLAELGLLDSDTASGALALSPVDRYSSRRHHHRPPQVDHATPGGDQKTAHAVFDKAGQVLKSFGVRSTVDMTPSLRRQTVDGTPIPQVVGWADDRLWAVVAGREPAFGSIDLWSW